MGGLSLSSEGITATKKFPSALFHQVPRSVSRESSAGAGCSPCAHQGEDTVGGPQPRASFSPGHHSLTLHLWF